MRLILVRHAETIYNAGARMQGDAMHTPLTRAGLAQAEAMGEALAAAMGGTPFDAWSSPAGRTLQTASIILEWLGRDFFSIRTDPRLLEIDVGEWTGRRYADVIAERGPIHSPTLGVFNVRPPGGEWYPAIAARLSSWLKTLDPERTALVITHGVTLRVLRGLLEGGTPYEGVLLADAAPQGTVFLYEEGVTSVLHMGTGRQGAVTP